MPLGTGYAEKEDGEVGMTNQEAIETIEANYPPENYTMLREALDMAIDMLKNQEPVKPVVRKGTIWCGKCGILVSQLDNYCSRCGHEVNWYDIGDEAKTAAENENDHPDGGGVSGAGDADRIRGD